MQELFHLLDFFSRSVSMIDGGTRCTEVRVPVHGCWNSRDVSVADVFDCFKEFMEFVM